MAAQTVARVRKDLRLASRREPPANPIVRDVPLKPRKDDRVFGAELYVMPEPRWRSTKDVLRWLRDELEAWIWLASCVTDTDAELGARISLDLREIVRAAAMALEDGTVPNFTTFPEEYVRSVVKAALERTGYDDEESVRLLLESAARGCEKLDLKECNGILAEPVRKQAEAEDVA